MMCPYVPGLLRWREMASLLLETKVYVPKLRRGLVPRPRLSERLTCRPAHRRLADRWEHPRPGEDFSGQLLERGARKTGQRGRIARVEAHDQSNVPASKTWAPFGPSQAAAPA